MRIMRTVILSVLAIMLMLTMASCDRDADAVRQMQIQAEQRKQQLMQQIQPTLLIGATSTMKCTMLSSVNHSRRSGGNIIGVSRSTIHKLRAIVNPF